jgi:hypothetical protein
MYFYSWGDPANWGNREVQTVEKRGMDVLYYELKLKV